MRISTHVKKEYEAILLEEGSDRLFSKVLGNGLVANYEIDNPEIMLLNLSDGFFASFRVTGNKNYFLIGTVMRRAAHKIYRELRRRGSIKHNKRFLQSVG